MDFNTLSAFFTLVFLPAVNAALPIFLALSAVGFLISSAVKVVFYLSELQGGDS